MKEIDARGLACPAPILLAKEALEKGNPNILTVTVDNAAAKQNVVRFLTSRGFRVSDTRKGNDFQVRGEKEEAIALHDMTCEMPAADAKKILVMIATDRVGYGDDVLGLKLMISFVKTLKEMGPDLWRLVFVNNGVKLTVKGSEVVEPLTELELNGNKILVCGTCLNHFNLLDQKLVGETTNMLDIVTAMQLADKVISI